MTIISPNTVAIPQTITATPVTVYGSTLPWRADVILPGVKVIHHLEYSITVEGITAANLKLTLQMDIGSGYEAVSGKVSCFTVPAGKDDRVTISHSVPYYDGIAGYVPSYRLIAECTSGSVTLHRAEGRDAPPYGAGKQQHEFEGEEPEIIEVITVGLYPGIDYNIIQPTTWPVKVNYTDKLFAYIGDGRFATLFRGNTTTEAFETVVWKSVGISLEGYPVIPSAITQQYSGGANLGDYDNTIFIGAGNGKAVASWQNFGVVQTYVAAGGGGLSMTMRDPVADYPIPAAYDDLLNCSRAAVTYIPATDKLIFLMQENTGDFQPYTRSSTLGNDGVFTNHDISPDRLWDATVEFVDIESRICAGPVGGSGGFVICAQLYNNTTRRFSFIHQSVSAAGDLSEITETNFPATSYGYTFDTPVALIGSNNQNKFILLIASGSLLFAMLCTVSGGTVTTSTPLLLATLSSASAKQGSGAWITNTNNCIVQYSNDDNVYYAVLDASGATVTASQTATLTAEGDGSAYGQIVYDPTRDYYMSCYNEDATGADNNHHRVRTIEYKDNIPALTSGVPVAVATIPLDVANMYKIVSTSGHTALTVTLTNLTGDVDLYVRANARPNSGQYDAISANAGLLDETCNLVNTASTTWYIAIDAYESGACTLTATLS